MQRSHFGFGNDAVPIAVPKIYSQANDQHTRKRICVIVGSMTIKMPQKTIAKTGSTGTNGHLNGRVRFGCLLRRTKTAPATIIKAPNVPIFTISATMPIGVTPANTEVIQATSSELRTGTFVLWLIRPKNFGSNPSRDITNKIRLYPKNKTNNTDVKPQIAPTETTAAPQ